MTPETQRIRVDGWCGIPEPGAIPHCSQHGWREAVWERDSEGRWIETAATMRPIIAYGWDGSVTLGEPRRVL